MGKKNEYIQLPPMKRDTSADVVSFIWEYMKLPEEVREKVKSGMDEIREHCRDNESQRPNLYEIASAEEVAGLEKSMQKIIADIYYRGQQCCQLGVCREICTS